jgi:hypothetical protein
VATGAVLTEFAGRGGFQGVDEGDALAGPACLVPCPFGQPPVDVDLVGHQCLVQFLRHGLEPALHERGGALFEHGHVRLPAPAQFLVVVEMGLELAASVGERPVLEVGRLEQEGVAFGCGRGEFRYPSGEFFEAGLGDGVGPLDAVIAARHRLRRDQSRVLQLAELGVDLRVRGVPDVCGRPVEVLGEVVAGHRLHREDGQQGVSQGHRVRPPPDAQRPAMRVSLPVAG